MHCAVKYTLFIYDLCSKYYYYTLNMYHNFKS